MDNEFNVVVKPREVLKVLASIQVSNGEVFFPMMSLVLKGKDNYYCVQHTKTGLPLPKFLVGESGKYENFTFTKLTTNQYSMLKSAIVHYELREHKFHLSPFTFIYTAMLFKYDVDLFDIGIFEV